MLTEGKVSNKYISLLYRLASSKNIYICKNLSDLSTL